MPQQGIFFFHYKAEDRNIDVTIAFPPEAKLKKEKIRTVYGKANCVSDHAGTFYGSLSLAQSAGISGRKQGESEKLLHFYCRCTVLRSLRETTA